MHPSPPALKTRSPPQSKSQVDHPAALLTVVSHGTPRTISWGRASLVTRTHAHTITASRASSPFPAPPPSTTGTRALLRRRRSLDRSIARSRAHGVALAMELAIGYTTRHARHARAHVIIAHRARHHRHLPRCQPCAHAAFARLLICCCVRRHAAHRTCARDLGALVSATPSCMTPHPLCNTHGTHAAHNTTRRR